MLVDGLYKLLIADPGVQAQLFPRSDSLNGIFPSLAPTSATLGYVTYIQIHADPIISMQGANKTQYARMRYNCFGSNYPNALALQWAVKNILNGYVGTLTDPDNTVIQSCFMVDETDGPIDADLKGQTYSRVIEFDIIFVDNKTGPA